MVIPVGKSASAYLSSGGGYILEVLIGLCGTRLISGEAANKQGYVCLVEVVSEK